MLLSNSREEELIVNIERFDDLQEEIHETTRRLKLAEMPPEKWELLNELQKIVRQAKQVLANSDPEETRTIYHPFRRPIGARTNSICKSPK
jgi:hypothetical protein